MLTHRCAEPVKAWTEDVLKREQSDKKRGADHTCPYCVRQSGGHIDLQEFLSVDIIIVSIRICVANQQCVSSNILSNGHSSERPSDAEPDHGLP